MDALLREKHDCVEPLTKEEVREQVKSLSLSGLKPKQIVLQTGLEPGQVQNAISLLRHYGELPTKKRQKLKPSTPSAPVREKNILLPEDECKKNGNRGGLKFSRRRCTGTVVSYDWQKRGRAADGHGFVQADDDGGKALMTAAMLSRCLNTTSVRPGEKLIYIERDGPGGKIVVAIIQRFTLIDGSGNY